MCSDSTPKVDSQHHRPPSREREPLRDLHPPKSSHPSPSLQDAYLSVVGLYPVYRSFPLFLTPKLPSNLAHLSRIPITLPYSEQHLVNPKNVFALHSQDALHVTLLFIF